MIFNRDLMTTQVKKIETFDFGFSARSINLDQLLVQQTKKTISAN
jgi:hypothetical protein